MIGTTIIELMIVLGPLMFESKDKSNNKGFVWIDTTLMELMILLGPLLLFSKDKSNNSYTTYQTLQSSIFPTELPEIFKKNTKKVRDFLVQNWTSFKFGYFYAKKRDNFYYANLIKKLSKKHLNIKITPEEVKQDLYYSTKFGPIYYERKFKGYFNSHVWPFILNKLFWVTGFLIFLNKNSSVDLDLTRYKPQWEISKEFSFLNLSGLEFVEWIFFLVIVVRILGLLLFWFTLSDRRVSIYGPQSNLLNKLDKKHHNSFKIGVFIFSLFSRLGIFSRIIMYYLILCNLHIWILPLIKIPFIFGLVQYIADLFFTLCGFTQDDYYLLDRLVKKSKDFYKD